MAVYRINRRASKDLVVMYKLSSYGTFETISYRSALQDVIDYEPLPSRKKILNQIMEALKDPDVNMIGVFGKSGVGKSTLAEHVCKQAKKLELFNVTVMATVSEKPELKKIQEKIADALDLELEEESEAARAGQLRQRMMEENKTLVILDDLETQFDLEALGIPSENDRAVCKILFTSKNGDALPLSSKMDKQKKFELTVLTEEEALILFTRTVADAEDPPLRSIATEIVKKCAGLPFLITTVARALENQKNSSVWENALKHLSAYDSEDIVTKVCFSLELSYNHSVSDEVKSFFMLCALHGNSYICTLDLLKSSMGLGLFGKINTLKDARRRVDKLIRDLKASWLLLDSDMKGFLKMDDIVQDVAVSSATTRTQRVFTVRNGVGFEWPNKDGLKNYNYMSLPYCDIHELPAVLECPGLELLFLFTADPSLQIPDLFFNVTRKLKVLNLTGMCFSSLPPSLGFLPNLHTLCLEKCVLSEIHIIGELKKLEILSFRRSDIVELPREIGQLAKLKLLDLSHCYQLEVIPANVLSQLSQLEELYVGDSFVQWAGEGINNQSNASLVELKHLLSLKNLEIQVLDAKILPKDLLSKRLERYRIFIGNEWDWRGNYETSRTLKLKLDTNIHEVDGAKMLLKKSEDLYLDGMKGIKSLLYDLDREGFPQLRHLHVQNGLEIQYLVNTVKWILVVNAFPLLESLFLQNLTRLEKIYHGQLAVGSFSKLRTLKVASCNGLKNLFSLSMVRGLSQLCEMEVTDCNNMEEIVANEIQADDDENEAAEFTHLCLLTLQSLPRLQSFCSRRAPSTSQTQTRQGHLISNPVFQEIASKGEPSILPIFNGRVFLPKLERLKLSSIPCEKIWHDQIQLSATFSNLKSLIVERCQNLKYFFASSLGKSLLHLKELEICDCDSLQVTYQLQDEGSNIVKTNL